MTGMLVLGSGCHLLLGLQPGNAERVDARDRGLELGPPSDRDGSRREKPSRDGMPAGDRKAVDRSLVDRSLVDRSFTPCQESWGNGWVLQGQSGVNCYGFCADPAGSYSIDCDWSGRCTCYGTGINNVCATTEDCDMLVNHGCCK